MLVSTDETKKKNIKEKQKKKKIYIRTSAFPILLFPVAIFWPSEHRKLKKQNKPKNRVSRNRDTQQNGQNQIFKNYKYLLCI